MWNHHGGCFARGTMHRIFLLLLVSALSLTCVSPAAAQKEKKKKPDASSSGDASKAPIPLTDEQQIDYTQKSTRLNSSHSQISYAVFCLKKKKTHFTYFSIILT